MYNMSSDREDMEDMGDMGRHGSAQDVKSARALVEIPKRCEFQKGQQGRKKRERDKSGEDKAGVRFELS